MFRLICVLLIVVSSSGCALGLIKEYLGENVATHADDQSVESPESGGNKGYIKVTSDSHL